MSDDYDAADSQIKTGVMARDAADSLDDALLALVEAQLNAYDDQEELAEIVQQVSEMRDRYRSTGEVL